MPRIAEQQLSEVGPIAADGTLDVTIITPGWGSSGYYSAQVCEAAAALVKPGTPMYLDHAGATEALDRPGRSVKDIGATFITEGAWDGKRVHAKARLVPGPYRETLLALQETIGTSVSGDATALTQGEAEGRAGRIVEGVASIGSVDFVTRAGRGGSFRSVLESALLEEAVLTASEDTTLSEATASDRMEHLRHAVRSSHGENGNTSAWVRDQDAEKKIVWYDVHDHRDGGPAKTFEQGYTVDSNDAGVTLAGDPKHVRAVTKYVKVGKSGPVKESQEDHMPQIEEAELNRLREAESQNATLLRERDEARQSDTDARRRLAEADAREEARTAARARAVSGNGSLPEPALARIVESATAKIPLTSDGKLDAVTLHASVDRLRESEETYLRTLVSESGAQIKDFGESADPAATGGTTTVTEAKRTHTPFGRKIEEAS